MNYLNQHFRVSTLLVIIVVGSLTFFSFPIQSTQAQQLSATCSTKFEFPSNFKSETNYPLIARLGEDNSLYIFNISSGQLLRIEANTKHIEQYDLAHKMDTKTIMDFLPDSNSTVWILTAFNQLYKYDFQSRSLENYTIPPNIRLIPCSLMPSMTGFSTHSVSRIGNTTSLLFCSEQQTSVAEQDSWNLTLMDSATNSITFIAGIIGPTGSYRPWDSVIAGRDGKIYVYTTHNEFAKTIANEFADLYSKNAVILSYDPTLRMWNNIIIPRQQTVLEGSLVAVDEHSDIYLSTHVLGNAANVKVTKFSSFGDVVWSLTQDEVGSGAKFVGVRSNGNLDFMKEPGLSTQGNVEECTVNLPEPRHTATNTP